MEQITTLINQTMPGEFSFEPWMWQVFVTIVMTGALAWLSRFLLTKIAAQFERTKNWWDDALLHAIRKPLRLVIWAVGLALAVQIAARKQHETIANFATDALDVIVIGAMAWALFRFISNVESNYFRRGTAGKKFDKTTLSAISKLLRIAVLLTAGLMMLQELGFSVSGVMAAGGVGGLAIGFAAKDMLANFFGALMIYLDKPFKVGDWIRSPDQEIEGTVEDIGWRATRIRTFDKRPLYVPNSIFTTISVENPSRMTNRRIEETIGVRYDDIHQIQAITDGIEAMLREHEAIDTTKTLFVHLNGFGASSVDILIYCFTKTTEWVPFHGIKQDILLKIAEVIESKGAEMAFPTRTLHVQGDALPADLNS